MVREEGTKPSSLAPHVQETQGKTLRESGDPIQSTDVQQSQATVQEHFWLTIMFFSFTVQQQGNTLLVTYTA